MQNKGRREVPSIASGNNPNTQTPKRNAPPKTVTPRITPSGTLRPANVMSDHTVTPKIIAKYAPTITYVHKKRAS